MHIQEHEIYTAAERLQKQAHRTPVQQSRSFDRQAGQTVVFKCEQFQRTGSFKYRGAFNKIASLTPEKRKLGVAAFSSGNHAQAVALAAHHFNIPAVIYMPQDASAVKVAAVRDYGARIIFYDRQTQNREELATRLAVERQLTLVPPASDREIIAGHATVALELLQDVSDLDVIAVPVGGGGLLAGTCMSAHLLAPRLRVVGVQTQAANHGYLSLHRQQHITIRPPETIADGLRTTTLGELNWSIIQHMVDDILLVSEEEVYATMYFLFLHLKIVVEPSGAVAAAAALVGKLRSFGNRVGVVLSGGNVDPLILSRVLTKDA